MALSWGLGHPPQSMALPLHVRGLEARHPRNLTLKLTPWRPKSQGQVLIHGLCVTVLRASKLPGAGVQSCWVYELRRVQRSFLGLRLCPCWKHAAAGGVWC